MAALTPPQLREAKRLVVKIGSALLVDRGSGQLKSDWLMGLAEDVADLKASGAQVILVSSGSIALGRAVLGLGDGPIRLEEAQAAAAVGQIRLARAYEEAFAPHGLTTAQILVTLDDSADRRRYLNSRATLGALLARGVLPIVNENDTVATDEIRYGDNDRLAANVAVMAGADQLILLSDVDGFYDGDPAQEGSQRFEVIEDITPEIEAMAGDAASGLSKGGMKTKLLAARTAMQGGCAMAITLGTRHKPLTEFVNGASATWFLAGSDPHDARQNWIAAMKPKGTLVLDDGAVAALGRGKSLLPAGVVAVEGAFRRGDPVAIVTKRGGRLGIGLSRYTGEEARAIAGHRSEQIEAILGYPSRAALVHRDDMAL